MLDSCVSCIHLLMIGLFGDKLLLVGFGYMFLDDVDCLEEE